MFSAYASQEGGFRALYRGFVPTLMGMVPYAGFSFYCFEMLKFVCMKYAPGVTCDRLERNTGKYGGWREFEGIVVCLLWLNGIFFWSSWPVLDSGAKKKLLIINKSYDEVIWIILLIEQKHWNLAWNELTTLFKRTMLKSVTISE